MYRYFYDNAGNLMQVKNDSETQVVNSYTYTPTGLLDTAMFKDKSGSTRMLSNSWDADSNRVSFNANGTEYEMVCDPTAGIPAVIEESSGGISVYYIREPGGELIARLYPTECIRYYRFGELGSTRLLTDGSGNVTDRYAYDAYGSLLSHDRFEGSVNQPYQYVGQLGYYTHWMEPDFGLLQLGVRFYDPEVGRFTQRDPMPVTLNPYAYAGDTPFRSVDPSGLTSIIVNPGAYQSCAAAACKNGGANLFSDVYTRRVKRLDKWAFVKCVAGATWSDMIKAAACVFTCRQSIISPTAFAACFAECMAPGLGDEPTIDEIIQCYNRSKRWVTEEARVKCCEPYFSDVIICDRMPPSDPGWQKHREY